MLFFTLPVLSFFMFPPRYKNLRNIMLIIPVCLCLYRAYEYHKEIFEITPIFLLNYLLVIIIIFFILILIVNHFYNATHQAESRILEEYERAESLLLNVLPPQIADRLKAGEETISDYYEEVSILFADLVGFTNLTTRIKAEEIVALLNTIFFSFDEKCNELDLEKIKTMGDGYMVMGGGLRKESEHLEKIIELGLFMINFIKTINQRYDTELEIRIGVHMGEAIAGVIGKTKFSFDLWGVTVNLASRLESGGVPMKIQITEQVKSRLKGDYSLESRGEIEAKGLGPVKTYLLSK